MEDKKKERNNFARYTSVSFQMLVIIGLFAFAGYKLDAYRHSKSPIFTAVFGLAGVVISLYQVVRQLDKKE